MTKQEIQGTLKAMQIIMHLQGHLQDMARNEKRQNSGNAECRIWPEMKKDKIQEMLKCADESLRLAVQAMNSAVVIELMDGGDQA